MKNSKLICTCSVLVAASAILAYGQDTFRELPSAHFILRYEQGLEEAYLYQMKDTAEKYYTVITQDFNLIRDRLWLWENRAKIIIAKDKESYINTFPCSDWSGACVDYFSKIIYTFPKQDRFNSILVHELTHIIFREYVRRGTYPLWLDEGMATYMENKHAGGIYQRGFPYLKQKIEDGTYMPFSELSQVTPESLGSKSEDEVSLFYLESFSIIHFIAQKYGSDNLHRFLFFLKQGQTVENSFYRMAYELKNIVELEKAWKRFYQR